MLYLERKVLLSQMERFIETSEKQDLNNFLLETLAGIDFHQQKLIPNNNEWSLFFQKYTVYKRVA